MNKKQEINNLKNEIKKLKDYCEYLENKDNGARFIENQFLWDKANYVVEWADKYNKKIENLQIYLRCKPKKVKIKEETIDRIIFYIKFINNCYEDVILLVDKIRCEYKIHTKEDAKIYSYLTEYFKEENNETKNK